MAAISRTSVTIGTSATLAELHDMIRAADRLGAPDDARVTGGLISGIAIGWTPAPAVEPAVSPPAPPGHEEHRRPDGTMPPACAEASRRAAEPVGLNITVAGMNAGAVRRSFRDLGNLR